MFGSKAGVGETLTCVKPDAKMGQEDGSTMTWNCVSFLWFSLAQRIVQKLFFACLFVEIDSFRTTSICIYLIYRTWGGKDVERNKFNPQTFTCPAGVVMRSCANSCCVPWNAVIAIALSKTTRNWPSYELKENFGWWQLKYFLMFIPTWRNWTQFDVRIFFQMGPGEKPPSRNSFTSFTRLCWGRASRGSKRAISPHVASRCPVVRHLVDVFFGEKGPIIVEKTHYTYKVGHLAVINEVKSLLWVGL